MRKRLVAAVSAVVAGVLTVSAWVNHEAFSCYAEEVSFLKSSPFSIGGEVSTRVPKDVPFFVPDWWCGFAEAQLLFVGAAFALSFALFFSIAWLLSQ